MGEIASWQRQNFKKSGPDKLSTGSMHPKLGGAKKVARFADGGEVDEATLKSEGLAASASEGSLWDRIKAGNIDDPESKAYAQYGAGRGRVDRFAEESRKAVPEAQTPTDDDVRVAMGGTTTESRMSDDDFRKSEKDTTAVAAPKRTSFSDAFKSAKDGSTFEWNGKQYKKEYAKSAAPAKTAARPVMPAKQSLSQSKGAEYSALEQAARRAESDPKTSAAARAAIRANADRARKTYEDTAAAEKEGRSVVLKR